MSYFHQIRKSTDGSSLVKELSDKLARYYAEQGIEDFAEIRQMRVDTDAIAYTDAEDNQLNGDLDDSSPVAYTDASDNNLYTPPFEVYFTSTTPESPPLKAAMFEVRFKI